jgi:hypothetical protein
VRSLRELFQRWGTDKDELGLPSLGELFRRWGTDKDSQGYTGLYEFLFQEQRKQVTSLLEIGIGTMIPGAAASMVGYAAEHYKPGGSLRAWRDYFPNAEIYGLDIMRDTQFYDNRITTYLCDSTNASQAKELLSSLKHKEFDVIVDDGCHLPNDQIATLRNFFPALKTRGIYVIEDLMGLQHMPALIENVVGNCPYFFKFGPCTALVIKKSSATAA